MSLLRRIAGWLRGENVDGLTVARAVASYIAWRRTENPSENVIALYQTTLERLFCTYLLPADLLFANAIAIGDLLLRDLSSDHLVQFFNGLDEHRRRVNRCDPVRSAKPLADSSRRDYRTVIAAFLNWCVKHRYLNTPIAIPRIKCDRKRLPICPPETVGRMINHTRKMWDRTRKFEHRRTYILLLLLAHTGIRASELVSLKVADCNFKGDRRGFWVRGKGGKERWVDIPTSIAKDLILYCDHCRLEGYAYIAWSGRPKRLAKWRTVPDSERRMDRCALSRLLYRMAVRLGEDPALCSPHKWRHSFGTLAARAGADREALQAVMGHADRRTTDQYILDNAEGGSRVVELVSTVFAHVSGGGR